MSICVILKEGHLWMGWKSQPREGSFPPPTPHLALFGFLGTFLTLASWEPVFQGVSYSRFSEVAAAAVA